MGGGGELHKYKLDFIDNRKFTLDSALILDSIKRDFIYGLPRDNSLAMTDSLYRLPRTDALAMTKKFGLPRSFYSLAMADSLAIAENFTQNFYSNPNIRSVQ